MRNRLPLALAVAVAGLVACQQDAPSPTASATGRNADDALVERVGQPFSFDLPSASASRSALSDLSIMSGALTVQDGTDGITPAMLAQSLVGAGVTISNIVYHGTDRSSGFFQGGTGIINLEDGVILSSGCAKGVIGPNNNSGGTCANGIPGDAQLSALTGKTTFDATVLEFDFVPDADKVYIQYVFGSEEYNEWANTVYDDVFMFLVNGTNCATIDGQRVSINTINGGNPLGTNPHNAALFNNNTPQVVNTQLDGFTNVLVCEAPVNKGVTNHMKLAIADASDGILDSDVFIKAGSITTTPVNVPPTANAGADAASECVAGGASIMLDGTGSSDSDGSIASYSWSEGGVEIATGATPTVHLSLGTHTITLTVTDDKGATGTDDVVVTVQDTQAPVVSLSASPGTLWPPNHKYWDIATSASATDACVGSSLAVSGSVVSNEADEAGPVGDGHFTGDIRVTQSDGTVLLSSNASPTVPFNALLDALQLRAERDGVSTGRVYTITISATDGSGHTSTQTATVTVAHNQ